MAASILIVDDDAVARRLVENMVQKCGYETLVVESGDAAIAMLTAPDAPAIDAVVLDLVMPGLDGMGVLAKIREAGLSVPVIVQTAHGGIDNAASARNCSPAPSMGAASANQSRSLPSIAVLFPTIWWSRSCSAMRRAPSPAPPNATPANSSRPPAARCSSTKSANCRWPPR